MSKYRVVEEHGGFVVESRTWWCPSWIQIAPHPTRPRFKTLEAAMACIDRLKSPPAKRIAHEE